MAAPQPVVLQPGMAQSGPPPPVVPVEPIWITPPADPPPPNCPPGLEYLLLVEDLVVIQRIEKLEIITRYETNNKYEVYNALGQQNFRLKEDSNALSRQWHGSSRSFNILVLDNYDRHIAHFYRPFKWKCCGYSMQEIEIESPPGNIIGFVRQEYTCCGSRFTVFDADKTTPLIKIVRPGCQVNYGAAHFELRDLSETTEIGAVRKHWSGFARERFTDADDFSISFPPDLDVKVKASLLGALMLIDFMYFED